MNENLSDLFGYYAFEAGALLKQHHFLEDSRVDTCFSLGRNPEACSIIADMEHLPLDFDSIDLIIANHVLECSTDPHQVLREIDRVLVADGHCFFIGFNPLAFWHNKHSFCEPTNKGVSTMTPELYGVRRVRDWISLLGWKVNKIAYISFRAKFMKGKLFDRLERFEKWGSLYWPIFGNLYVIHAQKQIVRTIPNKPDWDPSIVIPSKVAISPTTPRNSHHRNPK